MAVSFKFNHNYYLSSKFDNLVAIYRSKVGLKKQPVKVTKKDPVNRFGKIK